MSAPEITITVHVHYFAMLRELMGQSTASLTVPTGTTAGEIFALATASQPRLARLERSLLIMVNEDYVDRGQPLADGDDVAFIPPVSGGSGAPFVVTADVLDARAVEALVASDDSGAMVTFIGTVRDHARGMAVTRLDYEAYVPAAEKMLARIGTEIGDRWPGVRTAIHHRTGELSPGEASVVIACACAHRGDAFEAARYAIERIKQIVPIWKKEHYADGSTWVGSEAEYQALVNS